VSRYSCNGLIVKHVERADIDSDRSVHDAPRLIRDLLPRSKNESASTTAVRLMAVAKMFGRWAAEISADWNVKVRQQCLDLIEEIFSTLKDGPNLSELVVHERVSRLSKGMLSERGSSSNGF